MSSVQGLTEFAVERLTAAAEQVFRDLEKAFVEYEAEINSQGRLLDIVWKPNRKLHRTGLPQQHVCKEEEVLSVQQLCDQERSSSLDQEEPEPPQIKEEPETFMLSPTYEESEHSEPNSEQRLLSHNSPVAESHDQRGSEQLVDNSPPTKSHCNTLIKLVKKLLTAAAEQICRDFEKSVVEYEDKISRQRRLLDICLKPEIKLCRTELPQQHVCKKEEEEDISEQQLRDQERSSSLDQEEPEPPQIKEEKEEPVSSQEGEQLVLKQETETFMWIPPYEESEHSEPNGEQQLLPHNSPVAESHDQRDSEHVETGSPRNEEMTRPHNDTSHSDNVDNSSSTKSHCYTRTGEKPHSCETCGKCFRVISRLIVHMRVHTGEKPYPCETCGKWFSTKYSKTSHMKIHTGEKPYSCETCGKRFRTKYEKTSHTRVHTGEKPYPCETCGKCFKLSFQLNVHTRVHTGEKPYPCEICGKSCSTKSKQVSHMRVHTGEKPYSCETCGKGFRTSSDLNVHMSGHTGEKPYPCETCGKCFRFKHSMKKHTQIHTDKKSDTI